MTVFEWSSENFEEKQFYCEISCELEVTFESKR